MFEHAKITQKKTFHNEDTYDRFDTTVSNDDDNVLHLHEVPKAPFTEDILEEPQVLFVVGVWVELRGEQGQSLMKPCGPGNNLQR